MTEDVRQSPADERGGNVLTLVGRDPEWTNRVMGELWAHATKINLEPVRWRLGLFNLRDVIRARDPHFQDRAYSVVRPESVWGCTIEISTLFDAVALVAFDKSAPRETAYKTLVPGDQG